MAGSSDNQNGTNWIPASFFPVSPLMIFPEAMGTFSVFLRQGQDFVLYTRSGERFSDEHRHKLHQTGIGEIYVQTVEKPNFDDYVEENLGRILDNEAIPMEERSGVLAKATESVLLETFESKLPPAEKQGNFKRVANIVRQSMTFLSDERALKAMAPFIAHDYKTYTHSMHVFLYTVSVLNTYELDHEQLYEAGLGAMLHDLGKTRVPAKVLNKKGALNPEERRLIETHPLQGVALCANLDISQATFNCILFHHERMDGKGYPTGIKEEDIPLPVRAITLSDVYDALTSKRPYADAMTPFEALTLMRYDMKGHFDMEVFKRFIEVLSGAEIT